MLPRGERRERVGHLFKMQTTGARGPTHLVALYVATAGLQGNALGSDEEEITLLVYVLIDVLQNKVNTRELSTEYTPYSTKTSDTLAYLAGASKSGQLLTHEYQPNLLLFTGNQSTKRLEIYQDNSGGTIC